ncbi:MAG: hypothetical protein KAG84_05610, partial [Bacteroidales bacterium]|nr:hypothetical protein [Bacteroidales bacterium]
FENFHSFIDNWGEDAQNKFNDLISKAMDDVEKGVIKKARVNELLKLSSEDEEEYQLWKLEVERIWGDSPSE